MSPVPAGRAAAVAGSAGGGAGRFDEESQPFLSRDDAADGGHRAAPLVTEDNFTSTCPPPRESGFFESQLAADDQSLFDITHSLAEPALVPPPPLATLPNRRASQEEDRC